MTPTKIPHLCGGTFFDLLLEARRPRRKARDKYSGGTDGLTTVDVYNGLIFVVTGEKLDCAGSALKKCVSGYKSCSSSKGIYVPFVEPSTQSAFDSQYKRKDPDLLERMSGFIDTYLNETKCEWLVRAIIDVMQQEQLNVEIAVNYTDSLKVSDLHTAEKISFLPFLLSVLHYVIVNHPDCESGRPTFESWYLQPRPKAEWKFVSSIGSNINPLTVSIDLMIPNQRSHPVQETPSVPASSGNHDSRTDSQIIAEHFGKALLPLVAAVEAQNKQLLDAEQLAKPLLMLSTAMKTQEHETAEKIRASEKRSNNINNAFSNPDTVVDEKPSKETGNTYADSQAQNDTKESVLHQTIVNQFGDHPIHIDHVENLNL